MWTDIKQQLTYWTASSEEDLAAAHALLEKGQGRYPDFRSKETLEWLKAQL